MHNSTFQPIVIGALYPSIERGLSADLLAARALGGRAYPVCTSHIIAGHGRVTDVLEVPADTVSAQLEHLFETVVPTGAKIGIVGDGASAEAAFRLLGQHLQGPIVLDLTLSGPSGEDLADGRVREVIQRSLPLPDLVTLRRVDAELMVSMEIATLDDAQVAVQRMHRLGARNVLLRVGMLPLKAGEAAPTENFHTDLLYDGSDFALYEAPVLEGHLHGASSALTLALLQALWKEQPLQLAVQHAKRFATDALRLRETTLQPDVPAYYLAAQSQAVL